MTYERVKELTGKKRGLRTGEVIIKKNGEMAMEKQEVLDRWQEYNISGMRDQRSWSLVYKCLDLIIRKMKRKSIWQQQRCYISALDDFSIKKKTCIANKIVFNSGEVSEDMCTSINIYNCSKEIGNFSVQYTQNDKYNESSTSTKINLKDCAREDKK